jgi:toxin YoeB
VKNLEFDIRAFEDLVWWVETDRKKALKVFKLIKEVFRTPFEGTGQPEKLKHDLAGCWSRRIDQEHRLVYQVLHEEGDERRIRILACRFHYD